MSKDNGEKVKDKKEPQLIFKAELIFVDGKPDINFTINSKHIPTLDNISKELDFNIMMLRAAKITEKQSLVQKVSGMTLNDILKRGRTR